jgi:hypothetical protein
VAPAGPRSLIPGRSTKLRTVSGSSRLAADPVRSGADVVEGTPAGVERVPGLEGRFGRKRLDSRDLGVSHWRYAPGLRNPTAHSHREQEEAYIFKHVVTQEVTYESMPFAIRADLHERLANWIGQRTPDWVDEHEEIIGHHLEQAYQARLELGPATERTSGMARRAAALLSSSGRRAFAGAQQRPDPLR